MLAIALPQDDKFLVDLGLFGFILLDGMIKLKQSTIAFDDIIAEGRSPLAEFGIANGRRFGFRIEGGQPLVALDDCVAHRQHFPRHRVVIR